MTNFVAYFLIDGQKKLLKKMAKIESYGKFLKIQTFSLIISLVINGSIYSRDISKCAPVARYYIKRKV